MTEAAPLAAQQLQNALAEFAPLLKWERNAWRVLATCAGKRVTITWPLPLSEVYFDFWLDEQLVLSEWVEYYDGETSEEQALDVARIARNFLAHETRGVQVGQLFAHLELQFRQDEQWASVF